MRRRRVSPSQPTNHHQNQAKPEQTPAKPLPNSARISCFRIIRVTRPRFGGRRPTNRYPCTLRQDHQPQANRATFSQWTLPNCRPCPPLLPATNASPVHKAGTALEVDPSELPALSSIAASDQRTARTQSGDRVEVVGGWDGVVLFGYCGSIIGLVWDDLRSWAWSGWLMTQGWSCLDRWCLSWRRLALAGVVQNRRARRLRRRRGGAPGRG
jgi:hypothetical protein